MAWNIAASAPLTGMAASISGLEAKARPLDKQTGGIRAPSVNGSALRLEKRDAGLGVAIVQQLGSLLDHDIGVRSQLGKGSVVLIVVPGVAMMDLVLADHPSRDIAANPRISQRTVKNHRAAVMHKMGAKSLPELARQTLAAERKSL